MQERLDTAHKAALQIPASGQAERMFTCLGVLIAFAWLFTDLEHDQISSQL